MDRQLELTGLRSSIRDLLDEKITVDEFINEIISDKEGRHHLLVCRMLGDYFEEEGGSPAVSDFQVTRARFDKKSLTGSFDCEFRVGFSFGCEDVNTERKASVSWDFVISDDLESVELVREVTWRREAEGY